MSPASRCYALLSQCRASKWTGNVKTDAWIPRRYGRTLYHHVSDFKGNRMVSLQEVISWHFGSYDSALLWNQWIEEGRTPKGKFNGNTVLNGRHFLRMAVMDRTSSRCWGVVGILQRVWNCPRQRFVACLLRTGLVARTLLRRLALSRNQ